MRTLFVSDLHLAPERPHIVEQFLDFAGRIAKDADAVYVLGDLFEYWIGDDADEPLNGTIEDAVRKLAREGVPVFFMQGNRDVLLGHAFAQRCGARLIADPTLITLYGTPTLLLHGDTLCTRDREYQQFRTYARDPANQAKLLALPVEERRKKINGWLQASRRRKGAKTDEIMDVSSDAVDEALRTYGYPRMIHGHTHRPARHVHVVDSHACERWVLADWYECGAYLQCEDNGAITTHTAPWRATSSAC